MEQQYLFRKVLWAVDPLVKDFENQETVARVLRAIGKLRTPEIYPVSVILAAQIPFLCGTEKSLEDFKHQTEANLNRWLSKLELDQTHKFTLLVENEFSITGAVKTLTDYAVSGDFSLIIAAKHAKKRETGADLGTFAETLFLIGQKPLLLITPQSVVPSSFKEIFFPTDLSEASSGAMRRLIPTALGLQARITLFHKLIPFEKDLVEYPYSSDARSNYLEKIHDKKIEALTALTAELNDHNLKSRFIIDRIEADYVSTSIIQYAQNEKDSLIALVSRTKRDGHPIPGSITRQVIRNTVLPVLILHPEIAHND